MKDFSNTFTFNELSKDEVMDKWPSPPNDIESNLPWTYRTHELDDWGFIRDASGDLAACARGDKGRRSHDGHRAAGTDPYGEYAVLIVKAVNNHDALVKALTQIAWMDEFLSADAAREMMNIARDALTAVGSSPLPSKD